MSMPHTTNGEVTRRLGNSAGFAEWTQRGLNYITAVKRAAHGQIQATLGHYGSAFSDRTMTLSLTAAGWAALFDAITEVAAITAPPAGADGRLTAAEIHYAADIVERLSADTGAFNPGHYDWSADTMRAEATATYHTPATNGTEVTA